MLMNQYLFLLFKETKRCSKNDAVKKTQYDELVQKVNAIQTTDTSNLVQKTDYDTKLSEM